MVKLFVLKPETASFCSKHCAVQELRLTLQELAVNTKMLAATRCLVLQASPHSSAMTQLDPGLVPNNRMLTFSPGSVATRKSRNKLLASGQTNIVVINQQFVRV